MSNQVLKLNFPAHELDKLGHRYRCSLHAGTPFVYLAKINFIGSPACSHPGYLNCESLFWTLVLQDIYWTTFTLLKWLDKQSMQSLIDWFDCIELTNLKIEGMSDIQRSGDTKRDRLFFRLLGIPGFEEKPQN